MAVFANITSSVRAQVEALPPRSRVMLGVLMVLLGLTWMGGLWWWTSGSLAAQAEALSSEQRTLKNIQLLQVKYKQAEEKINQAEARLGSKTQNASTFIEQKANQIGIRPMLSSIDKLGTETRGKLKETRFRVTVRKAPVRGVHQFIHDIETSGFLVVEQVEYKNVFGREERTLNATIDLVSYELVKGE